MKDSKLQFRIGMVSMDELMTGKFTRIKLSKNLYSFGDAMEIIYKAQFPCILCDHIGTPVKAQ